MSPEKFITKAINIHNDKYCYDKVNYINCKLKVLIICNQCDSEFYQTPDNHLQGKGCPSCAIKINSAKKRKNINVFIDEANIIHNFKYNYSLVSKENFINKDIKIPIICILCNEIFNQTPGNHLHGNGCPTCYYNSKFSNKEEFIKQAIIVHKNNFNYDNIIYISSKIKINILCNKCNNYFNQNPCNHLQGQGCPFCINYISKSEILWLDSLSISKENRQYNIYIDKKLYKVDGFNPDTNTVYEFYGDYWHGNPIKFNSKDINLSTNTTFEFLYEKTIKREITLKNNGFNVISIWESDWKNV
jgi:formylmethanofuran dehydrogenase subunit E